MKKIGILTACRTNNIGTDLQAYAMQSLFSKYADVELINYVCDKLEVSHSIMPSLSVKNICKVPYRIYKNTVHAKFRKKHFRYSQNMYSSNSFEEIGDIYDVIVVGSDQIWNLNLTGNDLNFFLPTIVTPKYSYAASLGVTDVTEWEKKYHISKYLIEFEGVTVREASGVTALKQIGIESKEQLDPILVVDSCLWEALPNMNFKKPYMVIYQVSTPIHICKEAIRYGRKCGWTIIRISEPTMWCKNVKVNSFVTIEKWISIIRNAEMVITDSYHGLSFSIANKRNFRLLSLQMMSDNTRSICLLDKLELSSFVYSKDDFASKPNWNEVDRLLIGYRKDAVCYIKNICDDGDLK